MFVDINVDPEKAKYGADIKAFIKLYERYPDLMFWSYFVPFKFKPNLYVYLSPKFNDYIQKQYNLFLLDQRDRPEYNLEQNPVVQLPEFKKKPKSLLEFLRENYGKETS